MSSIQALRHHSHKGPNVPCFELQPTSSVSDRSILSHDIVAFNQSVFASEMLPRQRPKKESRDDAGSRDSHETATLASGSSVIEDPAPPAPPIRSENEGIKRTPDKADKGRKKQSLFKVWGAIELENKGSVARDHLALERTFLAWLRTSLAFASIGIAITQLFRLNIQVQDSAKSAPDITLSRLGKPLGSTFLGISIIVLVIGAQRYYESQDWLLKGKFPASRGSILTITAIAFLLIVASFIVVLLSRQSLG